MGHFDLGLQPGELRKLASSLDEMSEHLTSKGSTVAGTPGEIGEKWTGAAADSVKPEMTALGEAIGGAGFAGELTTAKRAIDTLAGHYETAEEDIGRLNTRWQTVQDMDDEETRTEREERLQREFDELRSDLESRTRTCSSDLGGTSPVGVTIDGPGGSPTVDTSDLLTTLALTGQHTGLSAYQSARRDIEDGDLPPFEEMTEEQRQDFLEGNPGLVDQLMAVDPASLDEDEQQFVDDVIALATPRVSGADGTTDGQTVLDAVDGEAPPSDFLSAFTDAGAVSDSMNLLTAWADRNGVDLTTSQIVGNAHDYQQEFVNSTGPRWEEIDTYLSANEHRWDTGEDAEAPGPRSGETDVFDTSGPFTPHWQERLNTIYADTILQTSDEDLGGDWDGLPDEIRDAITDTTGFTDRPGPDFPRLAAMLAHADAVPGDRMAVELGTSIGNAMENRESLSGPPGDQEYGHAPVLGEAAYGDLLGVLARNEEATAALLTGEGELPERYDRERLVENIYSYRWADGGEAASALTNWIDESFEAGEDSPHFGLANEALAGLHQTLTNTEDEVFKNMMEAMVGADQNPDGGNTNGALMQSLGRAVEHEHVLDHLATRTDAGEVSDATRLMTLLGTDEDAAGRMAGAVLAYNGDVMGRLADGDLTEEGAGFQAGSLRALLDAGVYNAAYFATEDQQAAEEAQAEALKTGIGMLTGLVPDPSGATGAAGGLLSHFVKADDVTDVTPHIDPAWDENGSHVVLPAYDALAQRLVADGVISPAEYDTVAGYDASSSPEHVGRYADLLEEHGVQPPGDLMNYYNNRFDEYRKSSEDGLDSLLENENAN